MDALVTSLESLMGPERMLAFLRAVLMLAGGGVAEANPLCLEEPAPDSARAPGGSDEDS